MKSFKLEPRRERIERERHSPWNIENYRYQNITKKLATTYIRGYWLMGLLLLLLHILYNVVIEKESGFNVYTVLIGISLLGLFMKNKWVGLLFLIFSTGILFNFMIQKPDVITIGNGVLLLLFIRSFYIGTVSLFKYNKFNKEAKEW